MDSKRISVRDLAAEDVPLVLKYWYHSPEGFVESLGVDLKKLPDEEQFEAGLRLRIANNLKTGKSNALAIVCDGKTIGMHTLNPYVEGDTGIFHAHIFIEDMRGKGIGIISYPLACEVYFKRFQLKKIQFKTPIRNRGAIRIKEKLGIPCVGEELIGFGIIQDRTRALCYQLTPELLLKIRG